MKLLFSLLCRGLGYIFPLVAFGLCAKQFGTKGLAEVVYFQAIVQFFFVFQDFGFSISSARSIAISVDGQHKTEIFLKTQGARLSITIFSIILFSIIGIIWKGYEKAFESIYLMGIAGIGNFFFPQWYFIGENKFDQFNLIGTAGKIITLSLLFFLRTEINLNEFLIILFSQTLLSALIFTFIEKSQIRRYQDIKVSLKGSLKELSQAFYPFLAIASSSVYVIGGTIVGKQFFPASFVASFSISEKIARAVSSIFQIRATIKYPEYAKKIIAPSKGSSADHYGSSLVPRLFFEAIFAYFLSLVLAFAYFRMLKSEHDQLPLFPIYFNSLIATIVCFSSHANMLIQSFGAFRSQFFFSSVSALVFLVLSIYLGASFHQKMFCLSVPVAETVCFFLMMYKIKKKNEN
jgi:O-antigen/teichoic acid export membrane protein